MQDWYEGRPAHFSVWLLQPGTLSDPNAIPRKIILERYTLLFNQLIKKCEITVISSKSPHTIKLSFGRVAAI